MNTATKKGARGGREVRRKLSGFAGRLLAEWKRRGWPLQDARVVVAVSGGADSTALLLALDELKGAGRVAANLIVAHLDHGLRGGRGEEDARWVEARASALGLEAVVGRADVGARARVRKDNLEQAARRARYEFLGGVARSRGAWAVLTAHTLDDQAETILLRLLRGSGADGLTGIRPERVLAEGGAVEDGAGVGGMTEGVGTRLLRPLVAWARRADTVGYCRERGVEFRTDEMNEDERFARVRVRRRLLPLLETFNPRVVEALARTAGLLGEDSEALDAEATRLLEEARTDTPPARDSAPAESMDASADDDASAATVSAEEAETLVGDAETSEAGAAWPLSVRALAAAPAALRRRALRQWIAQGRGDLRRLELAHVLAVERLLEGVRGGRVAELPGGCLVERRRGWLRFRVGVAAGARKGRDKAKVKR